MEPGFRLGLEIAPPAASGADVERWLALVGAAEEAGVGAVWLGAGASGEVGHADGTGDIGRAGGADPCTLAGALVPSTSSLLLGVVVGAGDDHRNPSVLARDVTALDVLSDGRAAVLLDDLGDPLSRRLEAALVCRLLFTEPVATLDGTYFQLSTAVNLPAPLREGGPPVLVQVPTTSPGQGSSGDEAALPAAAEGAGDGDVAVTLAASLAAAGAGVAVGGGPADVAAWRAVARDRPLLWRGVLPPEARDAGRWAAELHDAGADGLLVQLQPAAGPGDVQALVRHLAPDAAG